MEEKVTKCALCPDADRCLSDCAKAERQQNADKLNAMNEIIEVDKYQIKHGGNARQFAMEVQKILNKYNLK